MQSLMSSLAGHLLIIRISNVLTEPFVALQNLSRHDPNDIVRFGVDFRLIEHLVDSVHVRSDGISHIGTETFTDNVSRSTDWQWSVFSRDEKHSVVPFGIGWSTGDGFVYGDLIECSIHQIDETHTEWSEEIE